MQKTIAAISSPQGEGGIGVIRISGPQALNIAEKVFRPVTDKKISKAEGYTAHFGHIVDADGQEIDEAVVTVFRSPKSYTGEDVAEISCHGGRFVTKEVLRAVTGAGAHHAEAGEFTKRAFLNGKMDLAEAESVMGLIAAKGREELKLQLAAKNGKTSREVEAIETLLLEFSANVSAFSDYPDEDLEELSPERFLSLLSEILSRLDALISTYDSGTWLREGIRTAIVGKPNVGKSTLMNMLSREQRSIVTSLAGTTRDVVENTVNFGGFTLLLADTAGIRNAADEVEKVGVDLAIERISSAQLLLAVFDGSQPLDDDDREIMTKLNRGNTIIILNKADKGNILSAADFKDFATVCLCAKDGSGEEELKQEMNRLVGKEKLDGAAAVLLSERQRDLVQKARDSVAEAKTLLERGYTMDAVGVCADDALQDLYTLDGKRVTNEVADEVFRRFCVGK